LGAEPQITRETPQGDSQFPAESRGFARVGVVFAAAAVEKRPVQRGFEAVQPETSVHCGLQRAASPVGAPREAPPGVAADLNKPVKTLPVTGGPSCSAGSEDAEEGLTAPLAWRMIATVCEQSAHCRCALCRHERRAIHQFCPWWAQCFPSCSLCDADRRLAAGDSEELCELFQIGAPTRYVLQAGGRTVALEDADRSDATESTAARSSSSAREVGGPATTSEDIANNDVAGDGAKRLSSSARRRARAKKLAQSQ
jgi:hypothetical protein